MMTVAHNMAAMFSNRQLNITEENKKKTSEKLGSGYRINRSADGAAELSISEKMRWQIRGLSKTSDNIQDGVSLLRTADGALAEVHSILQRMNELSVQSANDTNTQADRTAIQQEIDVLISEIDRIGADTEFNTLKIFQGGYTTMLDPNGDPIPISQIPVQDFQLSRADLQKYPFNKYDGGGTLKLAVSTTQGYTEADWNLIYGNGNTSHSSLRISYQDSDGNTVWKSCEFANMTVSNVSISSDGTVCTRTLSYDFGGGLSFEVQQTVTVGENNGDSQYYTISHTIKNTGTKEANVEFMFNVDTAYSNDDLCEQYFIDGNRLGRSCLYTDRQEYLDQNSSYAHDTRVSGSPDGFSIINTESALPFSESIKFDSANKPNTICFGHYPEQGYWDYYDSLNTNLGRNMEKRDLTFGLIWDFQDMGAGATAGSTFFYGIQKASSDSNLQGVDINYNNSDQVHVNQLDLWIQSCETGGKGQFITIGEMNSTELGVKGLNVTTFDNCQHAISAVHHAIDMLSAQRSSIGAQQNRLEHAKLVNNNTEENTQAAESKLRDADVAEEMVSYAKHNILEQAGQSMLAQANQSTQGILSLLT